MTGRERDIIRTVVRALRGEADAIKHVDSFLTMYRIMVRKNYSAKQRAILLLDILLEDSKR